MAWLWSCGFPGTCPFDEPTVRVWLASSLTRRCHPITTSPVSPLTVAPPTTPMLLQVTFSIPHPMSSLFIPTTTNQKISPSGLSRSVIHFSHSWACKCRIEELADAVCAKGLLPGSQTSVSFAVHSHGGQGLGPTFSEHQFHPRGPSPWLNHLPETPPPAPSQ